MATLLLRVGSDSGSEVEDIDFDEMTLNDSRFDNLLDTLVEETEIDTESQSEISETTLRGETDLEADGSTVYILDSSRTDAVASTIVNF